MTTTLDFSTSAERHLRERGTHYSKETLQGITALVVGVGAVGSEVVKHLSLLGIGRIILVDYDEFEPSNLSRSVVLASALPLGEGDDLRKVEVAARVIQRWNPQVRVTALATRVESADIGPFLEADIVFNCVDSWPARIFTTIQAARAGLPMVEGGMHAREFELCDVFASWAAAGPCGSLCEIGEWKEHASRDVLPRHFRRRGCESLQKEAESYGGVTTLSMTGSIVAAQEVLMGLRLVRVARDGRPMGERVRYGDWIRLNANPSGSRYLHHKSTRACADCPLQEQQTLAMRGIQDSICVGSVEGLTLGDVRRAGARALNAPLQSCEVIVDQEIASVVGCRICEREFETARLVPRIEETHCRDLPLVAFHSTSRVGEYSLSRDHLQRIERATVTALGYGAWPGWIVRSVTEQAGTPVRVLVRTEAPSGTDRRARP